MRHLLLLLLGLLAFGTTLPMAPAQAMPTAAHHHALPPGHCKDDGRAAVHMCLGCAVDPAKPARVEPMLFVAIPAAIARPIPALSDHRPGFDPPPPRAA
ncbi:hypothetical protein HZF05_15405 [Sphingomonas sp. CGMCC 1.13654]|uniref:DUF2946 domain-containing protein n=1 Tax=Sphingomonas chungangi TaxID=2683589 RepID=A0A838L7L1_9SPHN|nr:hypothetical protein [Sphingomonas chungangi]MBA2935473.1 hypothetical protein [Sphingomonas chungangi]MVW56980.1 hypothetical protein [Sphingomonas chungangi]